jgi:hypothetical protein
VKIVTTLLNQRQAPSSADSRGSPIGILCYTPSQVVISFLHFHALGKNVEAQSQTTLQDEAASALCFPMAYMTSQSWLLDLAQLPGTPFLLLRLLVDVELRDER